jgi:hypothetical protein
LKAAKVRLVEVVEETGRNVEEFLSARRVRAIAPYTWQVGVDAEIR